MYRRGSVAEAFNAQLIFGVLVYVFIEVGLGQGFRFGSGSISDQVLNTLWFAALCGIASASTIEILKRVMHLRGVFQLRQVRNWLEERSRDGEPFEELLNALRLKESDALRIFDLPTEQLSAQVAAAADTALSSPGDYSVLLEALAGHRVPEALFAATADAEAAESVLEQRADFDFEQAVRTGIDQFQIAIGERWRITVQGAALWISGACGIGLTYASASIDDGGPRYVLAALLLGGPFAWVVRDAAALLERARR